MDAKAARGFGSSISMSTNSSRRKDLFYFEFDRPDVLELVPESVKRVLDVGCGTGRLGASIKRRKETEVIGIERDPVAAKRAQDRLDQVILGDISTDDIHFEPDSFDCVICADVLDHVIDPEAVLRVIRRWLRPDGHLITSLPNVRNHAVVRSLLAGNWTCEPAGLLDEDHVRFFTRREIEKLLFRSGFDIDEFRVVGGEGHHEWVEQGRSRKLSIGPFQLRAASVEEAEEFFAYQFLARATVSPNPVHEQTSIIIVTHNQLAYTRNCLESIRMRTTVPYELLIVDNGSTDGTVEYLSSRDDIRRILNRENRGFPAAANQGLAAANGSNLLFLNNDTLVTTGWLRRMLDALHSSPQIGLTGPLSNEVSGAQRIDVTYDDLAQLDGFAWDLSKRRRGVRISTDRLVGFCLLLKREVCDRIGFFDEQFGIGNFEDDDYCRRARNADLQSVIATDSFVHHFGSVTFRASSIDFGGLLSKNRKLYEEKWNGTGSEPTESGSLKETANASDRPKPSSGDNRATQATSEAIHLSACLIVRDNEDTIRPCLESLSPWVDELVVVDTGSVDATPQICEAFGARVYHWAWRDDFAAARNESLRYALGAWIFWMDSDDTIPADCGRKLRGLADGQHANDTLGYVIQVHCPGNDPADVTVVDHVKLFRNHHDLKFEFRIHEQILPAIRRADGRVEWTDIHVVHSGATRTPEGRARKIERDLRLLHRELRDRPDHPFMLFNLGMTYSEAEQPAEAVRYLNRCIQVSERTESHLRKAHAILAGVLMRLDDKRAAEKICEEGLALFAGDRELLFRRAMVRHDTGRLLEAVSDYRGILDRPVDRVFSSVDAGVAGYKARHNLAVVYEELSRPSEAMREWKQILAERPSYAPARSALRRLADKGVTVP